MRHLTVALIALCGWPAMASAGNKPPVEASAPAPAEALRGVEDPRAFVEQQYAAYLRDENGPDYPAYAYSDRLRALFDAYEAWTAQHEDLVGSLDFDWWLNAQDWGLSNVRVTETAEGPDRRTETARFNNSGREDEIRFLFVRQHGRWYLDDAVEGTGSGGDGWTLSALLQEREE